MTSCIPMAQLLQNYKERETTKSHAKERKRNQLITLLKEADRYVEELASFVLKTASNGRLSVDVVKEKEKQLSTWSKRKELIWKMKSELDKLKIPDPPSAVSIDIVGSKSLKVKFSPSVSSREPEAIVTKYKVEWSLRPDFQPLSGSREIMNLQKLEVVLSDLNHGASYFIRVAAGNAKGYSACAAAEPPSATPSSWMDVSGKKSRSLGRLCQLDSVFHQVIFTRDPDSPEIADIPYGSILGTPRQQRKQIRMSIRNLFTPTPKFQKYLERGVYLACLIYTDHRLLVTAEDTIPIMEVDEDCSSCLHSDFHWLMKIACTWEDTRSLRLEMEKTESSSSFHFRSRFLQAAEMMQAALGIQDLGQFYYKPIKDTDDTTVLCTVKYIQDSKSFNTMSLRWVPVTKLQRKLSVNVPPSQDVFTTNSKLFSTMQAMMTYNHVSKIPLSRGLYVAYVKISSSVDLIRILVPKTSPNILPYYKVRDNPHVSSEEWLWLKSKASRSIVNLTPRQLKFQKVLSSALRNLLKILDVPSDQVEDHRLFDNEVIELNSDVSLLLLLPPVHSVCAAPGQKDCITERKDCVLLPLQIFEIIHMITYQPSFISRYSRVSSLLEINTTNAQQVLREAFSTSEVASAKSRLRQLQQFQSQVDTTWRSMRWLMDVLNFARDRNSSGGILLSNFVRDKLDSPSTPVHSPKHFQSTYTLQGQSNFPGTNDLLHRTHFNYDTNPSSCSSLANVNCYSIPEFTATDMRRCSSISELVGSSKVLQLNSPPLFHPPSSQSISQKYRTLPRNYKIDSLSNEEISVDLVYNGSTSFPLANAMSGSDDLPQFDTSGIYRCSSISESMMSYSSGTVLLNSDQPLINQSKAQKSLTLPRNYKTCVLPNKYNSANHGTNSSSCFPFSNAPSDVRDSSQLTTSDIHRCSSISESIMNDSSKSGLLNLGPPFESSTSRADDQKNRTLPRNYKIGTFPNRNTSLSHIIENLSCFPSTNVSSPSNDFNQLTTSEIRRSLSTSGMVTRGDASKAAPIALSKLLQPSVNQSDAHKTQTLPSNYKIDSTLNSNVPTNRAILLGNGSSISSDSITCSESKMRRCSSISGLMVTDGTRQRALSNPFQPLQYFVNQPTSHYASSKMQRCSSVSGLTFTESMHKAVLSKTFNSLHYFSNKPAAYKIATLPRNYKIDTIPELQ